MTEPVFHLFGRVPLTPYGLGAAVALLIVLIAAGFLCRRRKIGFGPFISLCALAIPLCWLTARLVYVLANITYYTRTLGSLGFAGRFWDGGYAMTGALLGLILAGALTERLHRLAPGSLQDGLALGLPLGAAVLRQLERGTALGLGRAIETPWLAGSPFFAVKDITGATVHAVYNDETVLCLLLFIGLALWLLLRRGNIPRGDGMLVFLTVYGCAMVVLESLRDDGHLVVHFVRIQQVIAVILPVVALDVWSRRLMSRDSTKKRQALITWLLFAAAIGLGIVQEFAIDSSENLWLDYGIMAACVVAMAVSALRIRRLAERAL